MQIIIQTFSTYIFLVLLTSFKNLKIPYSTEFFINCSTDRLPSATCILVSIRSLHAMVSVLDLLIEEAFLIIP